MCTTLVRDEPPDGGLEAVVGGLEVVGADDPQEAGHGVVLHLLVARREGLGDAVTASRRNGLDRAAWIEIRGDVAELPRPSRVEAVPRRRQDSRPEDEADGLGERDEVSAARRDEQRLVRRAPRPDLEDVAARLDDVVEARDRASGVDGDALGDE